MLRFHDILFQNEDPAHRLTSHSFLYSLMPRTTSETNDNNTHPGSATTKSTKKVTIKNASGLPTIEERLGLLFT